MWEANDALQCRCPATYDNFHIRHDLGVVECEFPGRGYREGDLAGNDAIFSRQFITMAIMCLLQRCGAEYGQHYASHVRKYLKLSP